MTRFHILRRVCFWAIPLLILTICLAKPALSVLADGCDIQCLGDDGNSDQCYFANWVGAWSGCACLGNTLTLGCKPVQ